MERKTSSKEKSQSTRGGLATMKRTLTFIQDCLRQRDWAASLLGLAILVTAVAALLILVSKPMQVAALKRFHLASDHYGLWAVHQFVPSMYNFENKIVFSNLQTDFDDIDAQDLTLIKTTLNHFPARHVTFGDFRKKHFGEHDQATFQMMSTFRNQRLVSTWKIDKRDGQLWVTRVGEELTEASNPNE